MMAIERWTLAHPGVERMVNTMVLVLWRYLEYKRCRICFWNDMIWQNVVAASREEECQHVRGDCVQHWQNAAHYWRVKIFADERICSHLSSWRCELVHGIYLASHSEGQYPNYMQLVLSLKQPPTGLDTSGCLTCPDHQMVGWGKQNLIDSCPTGRYIWQINQLIAGHLVHGASKMFGGQVKFTDHLPKWQVSKNVNVEPRPFEQACGVSSKVTHWSRWSLVQVQFSGQTCTTDVRTAYWKTSDRHVILYESKRSLKTGFTVMRYIMHELRNWLCCAFKAMQAPLRGR